MNRLMLCAGKSRREGWKTLDCNREHSPDVLALIPPLPLSVKVIQWDEIEWIHGITSFYPWEAKALLIELKDALVSGGKLVLEQPDAQYVAQAVIHDPQYVRWLFGDPQFRNPAHMNKWAYSPDSLSQLLREVGFERVIQAAALHHEPARDFRLEAFA
jgi:hypothetical protein